MLLLWCAGRLTAAEFMLKPVKTTGGYERREGWLLPTWRDRDESDGNMKVSEKIMHGNGIGDQAGVKPKRRHWSWWCNDVTFSPRNGAPKPKAARRFNSPDCIHIPVPAQGRELSGFPMSVRLRHVLD